MKRTNAIQVLLDDDENENFRSRARTLGLTLSEYIRQCARKECGLPVLGQDRLQ